MKESERTYYNRYNIISTIQSDKIKRWERHKVTWVTTWGHQSQAISWSRLRTIPSGACQYSPTQDYLVEPLIKSWHVKTFILSCTFFSTTSVSTGKAFLWITSSSGSSGFTASTYAITSITLTSVFAYFTGTYVISITIVFGKYFSFSLFCVQVQIFTPFVSRASISEPVSARTLFLLCPLVLLHYKWTITLLIEQHSLLHSYIWEGVDAFRLQEFS